MPVADFSLPAWLNQDNTMLVPDAMAKGAAVGASIAHAMQGAAQVRQAQQRLNMIKAEDQRQQAEFEQKAKMEAMRYQGFQNFARDREILKSTGLPEDQASQQALMKNLHLITAGDPRALATVMDRSVDNERQASYVGVQRDRLAEAQRAAEAREKLAGENLDLRQKGLEETERYHKEGEKFRREKSASDYEKDLEIEQGRNMREYEGREATSKLEDQKQKNRIQLLKEKSALTKTIKSTLSTEDRLAMQAELKAAELVTDTDEKLAKIDQIHGKYGRLRKGMTGYDAAEIGVPVGVTAPASAKVSPANQDPTPRTQAEFDALPSGAWFINPKDGKRMRKK